MKIINKFLLTLMFFMLLGCGGGESEPNPIPPKVENNPPNVSVEENNIDVLERESIEINVSIEDPEGDNYTVSVSSSFEFIQLSYSNNKLLINTSNVD